MNKIKKILQKGGNLFPDAVSFNQLGTSNQAKYLNLITYQKPRKWKRNYSNSKLMQNGGEININMDKLYNTDFLHPSDSDRLGYKEPVGARIEIVKKTPILATINSKPCNVSTLQFGGQNGPFKRQSGGVLGFNPARSESDYTEGLNKGKNVFQFPTEGLKKMTMNPPSGAIEYPVHMEGYTDNKLTDNKLVQPGEDVQINGDTIVEKPDLTDFDFNNALDYALSKNLPIFVWNGNEYPVKRNNR